MKVKEFAVKKVSISSIKFDKTNPNVVSDDQMEALSKGMKKFGYLAPVILNEKLQVLDGEHRVKVYEKLGEKNIPAYVINANKLDGKMLRQIMNKLRGDHDFRADVLEFKQLDDAGKLKEFSELIAKPISEFKDKISAFDELMEVSNQKDAEITDVDTSKEITLNFSTNNDYRLVSSNLNEYGDTKESAIVEIIKFANQHRV